MKKKLLCIISTSLLLLLYVGIGFSANAQQPSDFSNLTLEIATTKKEFIKLEPIPIILSLSNETREPILGHTGLDFSQKHINLSVSYEGGKVRRVRDLTLLRKLKEVTPRIIEPNEHHQSKELWALNLDEIFPQPGSYQLQAVLINVGGKEKIKSNLLTVQILEPEGLDLQAYKYIRNSNVSYLFTGIGFTNSEKEQEITETLIINFSGSFYADHAAFTLGQFYFFRKEYEKAKEHFDKIKKTDFVFADKVSDYTDEINTKLRDSEKPN